MQDNNHGSPFFQIVQTNEKSTFFQSYQQTFNIGLNLFYAITTFLCGFTLTLLKNFYSWSDKAKKELDISNDGIITNGNGNMILEKRKFMYTLALSQHLKSCYCVNFIVWMIITIISILSSTGHILSDFLQLFVLLTGPGSCALHPSLYLYCRFATNRREARRKVLKDRLAAQLKARRQ